MSEKTKKMISCMEKIKEILNIIQPGNDWAIVYSTPENMPLDDWSRKYHQLINGDDYFFIYVNKDLLYTVNVTCDSILTAIHELVAKLAAKF